MRPVQAPLPAAAAAAADPCFNSLKYASTLYVHPSKAQQQAWKEDITVLEIDAFTIKHFLLVRDSAISPTTAAMGSGTKK